MANFIDDIEKMRDMKEMNKDDFLKMYSYLTEDDYIETFHLIIKNENDYFNKIKEEREMSKNKKLISFINTQIENAKGSIEDFPNIFSIHEIAIAKINVLQNVLNFIDENS